MILVANKVDLMHLRKITREQGKEMATKHNVGGVCAHWGARGCIEVSTPAVLVCGNGTQATLVVGPCRVGCFVKQDNRPERKHSCQFLEARMDFIVDCKMYRRLPGP